MNLGYRLKSYREERKLSQDDLAKKLFVSRQAISRWENNKTIPSLYSLTQIADLYSIPVEIILKEDEYTVAKEIDKKVNHGKIYRNIILGAVAFFIVFIGILSYGRQNQIAIIDRFNPFIKTEVGYAIAPIKNNSKKVSPGEYTPKKLMLISSRIRLAVMKNG